MGVVDSHWRVFPKAVAVRRVLSRTRPRRGVADLAPASGTDVVLPAQDELQRLMKAHGEKFSDEEVKEMMTSAVDVDGKVCAL